MIASRVRSWAAAAFVLAFLFLTLSAFYDPSFLLFGGPVSRPSTEGAPRLPVLLRDGSGQPFARDDNASSEDGGGARSVLAVRGPSAAAAAAATPLAGNARRFLPSFAPDDEPWPSGAAKGTAVYTHRSLPHPACMALAAIRRRAAVASGAEFADLEKYVKLGRDWFCFKHGGHSPGFPRWTETYLTIRNVVYHDGRFFRTDGGRTATLPYGGHFSMVSGNWPQLVTTQFVLEAPGLAERALVQRIAEWSGRRAAPTASDDAVPPAAVLVAAYLQPPTDFLSNYHVTCEVLLPLFHRLRDRIWYPTSALARLDDRNCSTEGAEQCVPFPSGPVPAHPHRPTAMITARPLFTGPTGFKKGSCSQATATADCVSTPLWGRLVLAALSDEPLAAAQTRQVHGLRPGEAQLRHVVNSNSAMVEAPLPARGSRLGAAAETAAGTFWIEELRVGNPTHCEPLWGPDAGFVEKAASVDPSLRRSRSYLDCVRLLWEFRLYFTAAFACGASGSQRGMPWCHSRDAAVPAESPVSVLLVSRKGDWARWLVNEDEVLGAMRRHLRLRHGARLVADDVAGGRIDGVRMVQMGGTYGDQIAHVVASTIFVANHGAGIISSVYLRPNAGLLTLSLADPGYYPLPVYPPWLHVRDMVVDQMCNRRLWRGKCKWSTPNNNDNLATQDQIQQMLSNLDSIIAAQTDAPRRPPVFFR